MSRACRRCRNKEDVEKGLRQAQSDTGNGIKKPVKLSLSKLYAEVVGIDWTSIGLM